MATQGNPSFYPGGFASGLVVRGMPLTQTYPGVVWWVSNNSTLPGGVSQQRIPLVNGSDGNKGTWNAPFATLNYAITQASAGDVIMVKSGHAETIATASAITINKGVAIVGLGMGANRPTFTWSAAASTIGVTGKNASIQNCLFISTMATPFTTVAFKEVNATVASDFTIENCEFRDSATTTGFLSHYLGGTTANQSDGLAFTNNIVIRSLATVTNVLASVVLQAAVSRVNFSNNFIVQNTANNNVALGIAFGANNSLNLRMFGNRTQSPNTGTTAGELMSGGATGSSGLLADNYSWHLASTGLIAPVSTKLGFVQNFCSITGAADKSALINPVAV